MVNHDSLEHRPENVHLWVPLSFFIFSSGLYPHAESNGDSTIVGYYSITSTSVTIQAHELFLNNIGSTIS